MKTCGSCGQLNLVGPPLRLSCLACGFSLKRQGSYHVPHEPSAQLSDHADKMRGVTGCYHTRPVGAPPNE